MIPSPVCSHGSPSLTVLGWVVQLTSCACKIEIADPAAGRLSAAGRSVSQLVPQLRARWVAVRVHRLHSPLTLTLSRRERGSGASGSRASGRRADGELREH